MPATAASATNNLLPAVPQGYYLHEYDDCGVEGRQPHVQMQDCYFFTFATSDTDAPLKERSAVFSYKGIQALYEKLDPALSYVLALTYSSDHVYNRTQSLAADGVLSREAAAGEHAAPAPVAADSAAPAPSAPAPATAAVVAPENAPQRTQKDAAAPAAARLAGRAEGESRAEIATAPAAPWRATPEAWVERIVKLRAEGRHDEADAELAALRARHPDLRLPAAALSTSARWFPGAGAGTARISGQRHQRRTSGRGGAPCYPRRQVPTRRLQ